MWCEKLIIQILDKYKIPNYNGILKWSNLQEYPHIVEIMINEDVYYLKAVVADKTKKEWIESIYLALDGDGLYIHPLKNVYGEYLTSVNQMCLDDKLNGNDSYYLLTKKMEKTDKVPGAEWWVNSLNGIHKRKIVINKNRKTINQVEKEKWKKSIILPDYFETINRLKKIEGIMEPDIKNLINSLLVSNQDDLLKNKEAVPVHGDPLNSNTALYNGNMILFDFESSGLSIPEYDIQRLFTDIATNCADIQEIDNFIANFLSTCEEKEIKIDLDALDYLYRIDLVRTICWLYEVSICYNRQDRDRQNIELEKYKAALRSGCYHRVVSAIHRTWHYDLTNIRINNQKEIIDIAELISSIVPDFVCATLGGSRSHFLDDGVSDVEMYFYSKTSIPSIEDINSVLYKVGAVHRRSPSFLWNENPWGPHSFFEIKGLYFEIGYRILGDTEEKIKKYLSGEMVEPQKDCHDLGLGYLFSGLAASIQAEKIVLCKDQNFFHLKKMVNQFPNKLREALKKEYMDTAKNLIKGKLYVAAQRQDIFFYNVLSTRVIRCLMIMAFSITGTHFPGDKWNEVLLLHTRWNDSKKFLQLLNSHMRMDASCVEKYALLLEAYNIVNNNLKNG